MATEAAFDPLYWPTMLQAAATLFAAVAAGASLWVAVLSPRRSAEEHAKLAEAAERRRLKLWVFSSIMQDRPRLNSQETVRCLNLIDALYHDVPEVRDCWARLHHALSTGTVWDQAKDIEVKGRTNELLSAMAKYLGLAADLRAADFARVYYPANMVDQQELEYLQRQVAKRHLNQQLATPPPAAPAEAPPSPPPPAPPPPPPGP